MPTFKQRYAAIMRAVKAEGAIRVPQHWATPALVNALETWGRLKHGRVGDTVVFCTQARWNEEMAKQQAVRGDKLDASTDAQTQEVTEGVGNR